MNNLVTGLVCGGITLGLYALCWFLVIWFSLPRWRAGINPLEEVWNLTEHGQSTLAAIARQQSLFENFGTQLAQGTGMQELIQNLDSLPLHQLGQGVCQWCEKNTADPRYVRYSKKVHLGPRYKQSSSGGVTIYAQSRHVTVKTHPRCSECAEVHRRVGLAFSWTVVGGSLLFFLLAPVFLLFGVQMISIWQPAPWVLLGTLALGLIIGIPWITLRNDPLRKEFLPKPTAFEAPTSSGQFTNRPSPASDGIATSYDFERTCTRDFGEHVRHQVSVPDKDTADLFLRSLSFVTYTSAGPVLPAHMRLFVEPNSSNKSINVFIGGSLSIPENAEIYSAGERNSVAVLTCASGENYFKNASMAMASLNATNLRQNHRVVLEQNRKEWFCAVVGTVLLLLGIVLLGIGGWMVSSDPSIAESTPFATRLSTLGGQTAMYGVLTCMIGFGMLVTSLLLNNRRKQRLLTDIKTDQE